MVSLWATLMDAWNLVVFEAAKLGCEFSESSANVIVLVEMLDRMLACVSYEKNAS